MAIFFYRLNPPRSTFPADMTPEEAAAMERHFSYWREAISGGSALIFGPVADPNGVYGVAILNAANHAAAKAICDADPALTAQLGFSFALHEMPNAVARGADA